MYEDIIIVRLVEPYDELEDGFEFGIRVFEGLSYDEANERGIWGYVEVEDEWDRTLYIHSDILDDIIARGV